MASYIHSIRQSHFPFRSFSFSASPRIQIFSLYLPLGTHSYAHFLNTLFKRVSFFSIFFSGLRFVLIFTLWGFFFSFFEFHLFWFRCPFLWWGLWEGKKEVQCGFHVVVVFLFFCWTIRLEGFLSFIFLFFLTNSFSVVLLDSLCTLWFPDYGNKVISLACVTCRWDYVMLIVL